MFREWKNISSEFEMAEWLHYRQRFCPPKSVLFDPNHSHNVIQHINTCRDCKIEYKRKIRIGETETLKYIESPTNSKLDCICILTESSEGWGRNGVYFNSPLVFVIDDVPGKYVVALMCSYCSFQRDGDIWLHNGPISGFIESWNTFLVLKGNVSKPLYLVEGISEKVKNEEYNPIVQGPGLLMFRRRELEVAKFFAAKN